MALVIHSSGDLASIVALGVASFAGARVVEADTELDSPLAAAEQAARLKPPPESQLVRRMYSRVGLDPTKTRPSSEALLRRVRRGESLPRINSLVDICNWCSLELQLPYGLYDLDHVEGPIELRLGRPGEEYAGIRKETVHVAGRLTLADDLGPFGNPSSDSARTMVTAGTVRALVVIFAPRELGPKQVSGALQVTADRVTRFTGARELERVIV
jgi:DNA/RNA-binding domain of Phe-tRNA-synthetase-like protein